jgi:hypothetical protein
MTVLPAVSLAEYSNVSSSTPAGGAYWTCVPLTIESPPLAGKLTRP